MAMGPFLDPLDSWHCSSQHLGVLEYQFSLIWHTPNISNGGFHKWMIPNSWMVYFMENPNLIAGWFRVTPIYGTPHIKLLPMFHCRMVHPHDAHMLKVSESMYPCDNWLCITIIYQLPHIPRTAGYITSYQYLYCIATVLPTSNVFLHKIPVWTELLLASD